MVRTMETKPDVEPTPEFNERVMDIVNRWQNAELSFKEALTQLSMLSQDAINTGNLVDQGRVEQVMAYIQHLRGNLDASIHHNQRARALFAKAPNRRRVAIIDLNQGENYRFKGDFARSLRLFQSAAKTAESLGDRVVQTLATVNEGLVLVTLKHDDEAVAAFQRGSELVETVEHNTTMARTLAEIHHGMAVVNLRAGRIEAAWNEASQALEMAKSDGDPLLRGLAFRTMGEVVTALGEVPVEGYSSDPDDYFRESLAALRELNAEAEMARTMFAQAMSMAHRGRRNNAARKLQHVMTIFTRLGMVDDATRAAEAQLAVT